MLFFYRYWLTSCICRTSFRRVLLHFQTTSNDFSHSMNLARRRVEFSFFPIHIVVVIIVSSVIIIVLFSSTTLSSKQSHFSHSVCWTTNLHICERILWTRIREHLNKFHLLCNHNFKKRDPKGHFWFFSPRYRKFKKDLILTYQTSSHMWFNGTLNSGQGSNWTHSTVLWKADERYSKSK